MGLATTLYGIRLSLLQAAIGSANQKLIQLINGPEKPKTNGISPRMGPRIKLATNGEIFFNEQLVSWDVFLERFGDPMFDGTEFHAYTESFEMTGPWSNSAEFWNAVQLEMATWGKGKPRYAAWNLVESEAKLIQAGLPEFDENDAAVELVKGRLTRTRKNETHEYGYGLECLCECLGEPLGTIEATGRLRSLRLSTRLLESRTPVDLPHYTGFPRIAFLSEFETKVEWERLANADLSFPDDSVIEGDRRLFGRCLASAAAKQLGVVAFEY